LFVHVTLEGQFTSNESVRLEMTDVSLILDQLVDS
jgi:hypothetical protein